MELQTILDALKLSSKKTRDFKPTIVIIFTDSQTLMIKIVEPKTKIDKDAIQILFINKNRK